MKVARLVVLGVALVAGGGAAYLMMGNKEPPPAPVVLAPTPVKTEGVLVAAHMLTAGNVVADGDMRWASWPKDQVPEGAILQSQQPNAIQDSKGLFVHSDIMAGEIIRPAGLAKDAGLAANLPTGKRAIAIDLADQKSYAGGFIHPHERVDVIRTFHPDDAPGAFASETILTNVQVLAIGQTLRGASGDQPVLGSTATLELTPEQAEKVVLAQRTGQLTLVLRSMVDASKDDKPTEQPQTMTIIRFGNTSQSRVR